MTQDMSREKSLLFLLSAVSRSLEVSPENKVKIRNSISTLLIQDAGDNWKISAEVLSGNRRDLEIAKDRFIFYPVKSAARYEINPAILNKNSAQEVLLTLFAEFDAQVAGKNFGPVQKKPSDLLPINLLWVSAFSMTAIYGLAPASVALILAHLFVTTSQYYISWARRWLLIAGLAIPAILFLSLNDFKNSDFIAALVQIAVLLIFDLANRLENNRGSKLLTAVTQLVSFASLGLAVAVKTEHEWLLFLFIFIVINGYLLLRQNVNSSLQNFLVVIYILLFIAYLVAAVFINPLRILLIPYVAYIALYETLVGDNRNPSKLAFGVVCLTI